MIAINYKLLNALEDLSLSTYLFLSRLRHDETLDEQGMSRPKRFLFDLTIQVFADESRFYEKIVDMAGRNSPLPNTNSLRREISDNILALPTLEHQEIYKSRINKVKDEAFAAMEQVSYLIGESEKLLPSLIKFNERWHDPILREKTLVELNSLDTTNIQLMESVQFKLNMASCIPIAIDLLKSLPRNPLCAYVAVLYNILNELTPSNDGDKNKEINYWEGRENLFNSMALIEVEQWFMQLAENNTKDGAPFLTNKKVIQFIDRAFVGKTEVQKLTLNMAEGERTSITKLFYLFYQRCTNDYAIETTKHCKEKYVRLLTDNFTNYKYDTVFGTFNNSKNAPKQWNTTV